MLILVLGYNPVAAVDFWTGEENKLLPLLFLDFSIFNNLRGTFFLPGVPKYIRFYVEEILMFNNNKKKKSSTNRFLYFLKNNKRHFSICITVNSQQIYLVKNQRNVLYFIYIYRYIYVTESRMRTWKYSIFLLFFIIFSIPIICLRIETGKLSFMSQPLYMFYQSLHLFCFVHWFKFKPTYFLVKISPA